MSGSMVMDEAEAVQVWNRTLPCTWSTMNTSFTTVNCGGVVMTLSYTCNSSLGCGALAVSNYEQFTVYGGQFFTELRVDGSTVTRGFTQCVGVGSSSCALDDRMAALSIAEPVTNGDTDTFTLVGRVASSSTTGYIYAYAVLNLIV
ncbi:MAG: hypothetical protein NZ888_03805 [Candidatus Nitrosocaldus sp.]|nr:hypothetical protein [Candidatus Nitrosocaldus sp.]MDW8000257.1 hypothetical protein [Candidatus Nitrosocaldus sp.]